MYQPYPCRPYSRSICNILVYGLIAERGYILLVDGRSKIVENGKIGRTRFLVVSAAGARSTSTTPSPLCSFAPGGRGGTYLLDTYLLLCFAQTWTLMIIKKLVKSNKQQQTIKQ